MRAPDSGQTKKGGSRSFVRQFDLEPMEFSHILAGFAVGYIIGLTGVGGGSLMTPLLILGFGVCRLPRKLGKQSFTLGIHALVRHNIIVVANKLCCVLQCGCIMYGTVLHKNLTKSMLQQRLYLWYHSRIPVLSPASYTEGCSGRGLGSIFHNIHTSMFIIYDMQDIEM